MNDELKNKLFNLEKEKQEIKKQIEINNEKERINDIKINGLTKLKSLIDLSDDYIKNSGKKTKYRGVIEKRSMILDTNPKFKLLYELLLIQQQQIKELEFKLKISQGQ